MKTKLILTLALALNLGACAFSKDPDAVKNALKNPSKESTEATIKTLAFTGDLNEENVLIEFVEDETPGMYNVVIEWPESIPAMKVSFNNYPYKIVNTENKFIFPVGHSQKAAIHLTALNALGGESSTYSAELTAPLDVILEKDLFLTEHTVLKANRLYLLKEGRIATNGFNLTLSVNKLFVDAPKDLKTNRMYFTDAKITTVVPTTVASKPKFLSGSQITIEAKKAYGHLRIAMIGFDGINGANGKNGSHGTKGLSGKKGFGEFVATFCGGPDEPRCQGRARGENHCKTKPTNGEQGTAGENGQNGQDGSNAGSPGNLSVFIDNDSEFVIEVAQRKGQPGRGGLGGQGGNGGEGGDAGATAPGCSNATKGAQGANGKNGQPGKDGAQSLLNHINTNVKQLISYEID